MKKTTIFVILTTVLIWLVYYLEISLLLAIFALPGFVLSSVLIIDFIKKRNNPSSLLLLCFAIAGLASLALYIYFHSIFFESADLGKHYPVYADILVSLFGVLMLAFPLFGVLKRKMIQ